MTQTVSASENRTEDNDMIDIKVKIKSRNGWM